MNNKRYSESDISDKRDNGLFILNEYPLWLKVPAAVRTEKSKFNTLVVLKCKKTAVFYADHGIAKENVHISATENSINSIDNSHINKSEIINLGAFHQQSFTNNSINLNIGMGTSNFCHKPAMSLEQLYRAINSGRQVAQRIKLNGANQYQGQAIGQGSTISTRAITCALLNKKPSQLAAFKDNINKQEFECENKLILQALSYHKQYLGSVLEILRRLGGFEIAALVGSYVACAHMGIMIIINNDVNAVAAKITSLICPHAEQWFIFSFSTEKTTLSEEYRQQK